MAIQHDNTGIDAEGKSPSVLDLINEHQIHLEEIAGAARVAAATCEDEPASSLYGGLSGTLRVIERDVQAVRHELDNVIDAVNAGTPDRPSNALDGSAVREQIADTILAKARRKGFTVHHSDGEFPYQLVGPKVTVEGLAEQVAELDGRPENGDGSGTVSALATFAAIQARCEEMPIDQVALELRRHMWDASEIMAATVDEDGYVVRKTWTRKGLRYFLAELEFLQSLMPDEGGAA